MKKVPSQYPQFSFRVSEKDKKRLNSKLKAVLVKVRSLQEENEFLIMKNDLILLALEKGLDLLELESDKKSKK
ncbi:MAG: hypothetical protein WC635_12490 [Bacteriovorax sp.]|jgi:hypothetical protein